MKKLIMLNSITYAYKARDFLYTKGYKVYIERIPANLRKNGCGYGIRVNGDMNTAIDLLESNGIHVKDIITI